ncbi:MAG: hypothetical protein Q8P02_03505 [Candidatus Micrarchaeota archaeon]|nr:hypothetical protein [Candidatus Micrarchaeota archaeon]
MVVIRASAPNKLHLCGEHSVVYGGFALVAPIEAGGRRNTVLLEPHDGPFRFEGDQGAAWVENRKPLGDAAYFPMVQTALFVCDKMGQGVPSLKAVSTWSNSPKGTGNSASMPVALALALYRYFGKSPSRRDLYDAGFVADNAYHGGKSSGGDVTAVLSNKVQKFRRVFEGGQVRPESSELDLHLPSGTALVLVSSNRGGETGSTAVLIEQFAKAHGVSNKPADMTDGERRAVCAPFDAVVEKIQAECHANGDAGALGRAFDENHALLKSVSTAEIDEAISTAKTAGALGGKLIGAGGPGGSLIVLAQAANVSAIAAALKEKNFQSWPVGLANRGPALD